MACRILVLGDSSSSGIGIGQSCYPFKLFESLRDRMAVDVRNCAVPGATSADVCRYYLTELSDVRFDYVLIYLGNNEAVAGVKKGRYRPIATRLKEMFSPPPPKQFRPILSPVPHKFEPTVPDMECSVTADEFSRNLELMVHRATKLGSKVVLINPVANTNFPSGAGAPNYVYFCTLDDLDDLDALGARIPRCPVDPESELLAKGLERFSLGDYAAAIDLWKSLVSGDTVLGFIAEHNIACARIRRGDDDGENTLPSLLGRYRTYDCIVLYNLAHSKRISGDLHAADTYMRQSYEQDASVYRIKEAYRDRVAEFGGKNGVRIYDLRSVLGAGHFIDYCHPTDIGHELIAQDIADLIMSDRPSAPDIQIRPEVSDYSVSLPAPNYLSRPGQTILDYYCMDWPVEPELIRQTVSEHKAGTPYSDASIGACIANFYKSNSLHPAFVPIFAHEKFPMPVSNEILSFPEFYMYRVLCGYYGYFEDNNLLVYLKKSRGIEKYLISSKNYNKINMRENKNSSILGKIPSDGSVVVGIVVNVCRDVLKSEGIFCSMIGTRSRMTLTWYTREAMRYGTQSRHSMLYARWDIDRFIESMVIGLSVAHKIDRTDLFPVIDELLSLLVALLDIHETHIGAYSRADGAFDVAKYQNELQENKASIARHIDLGNSEGGWLKGIDGDTE